MTPPDDGRLGEQPEPKVQEPERFPGGADSIEDEEKYGEIPDAPVGRDLTPEDNPALDDAPEELKQQDAETEGADDSEKDPDEASTPEDQASEDMP